MSKQLVTIDNLDEFLCRHDGKFYMDGSRILTPGAKDELAKRHIEVAQGCGCNHPGASCAQAAGEAKHGSQCCGTCSAPDSYHSPEVEDVLIAVAATLQKEYGVSDPDELRKISLEMVETLKKNLAIDY